MISLHIPVSTLLLNLSYETGQARYRLGADVPLIAFAPWVFKGNENLVVKENTMSFGCMTRTPIDFVQQTKEEPRISESTRGKIISLEPNHTHFILVRFSRFWTSDI